VRITIDNDTYRFYTADCSRVIVKKTSPRLYRHDIQLVEATRILQRKTIPDITVTQPKSTQFTSLYASDYKTFNISTFILPHIKSDKFTGIDLSSAIKP
jgi:hypothetical protein